MPTATRPEVLPARDRSATDGGSGITRPAQDWARRRGRDAQCQAQDPGAVVGRRRGRSWSAGSSGDVTGASWSPARRSRVGDHAGRGHASAITPWWSAGHAPAASTPTGSGALRRTRPARTLSASTSEYTTGTTSRVRNVELNSPPMTTVPSSAAMIEPSLKPGGERDERQDRRDGGHEDRPDTGPAALDERCPGGSPSRSQPLDEVEQDDRVGDHDADEHQEADERADADRAAGQEQRREGADGRQRQAEQDDERGDQRVEGQDHHHVDEQDGDAHRGEQAAERLVLLLADAGQLDASRRPGSCPRPRGRRCRPATAADTAPVSSLVISAVIDAAGAWSMRVMLPWTSACSTEATSPSGTLVDGPDRQRRGAPRPR